VGICRGRWWEFVEAVGGNRSLLDPGVAVFQALFFIDGVVGSSRIMILWMSGKWQVMGEVVYAGRRMSSV
jgi:hypothetical protein